MKQNYVIAINNPNKGEKIIIKKFNNDEEAQKFVDELNSAIEIGGAHAYVRDIF